MAPQQPHNNMSSRLALLCLGAAATTATTSHPPLWSGQFADGGRSGQGARLGPRVTSSPLSTAHQLYVSWRYEEEAGAASSQFYYGGIDAAGGVYWLTTGNGAGAHIVRKLDGRSGARLWSSTPRPRPAHADFAGVDHLVLRGADAVFVIAGSRVTLPDCG